MDVGVERLARLGVAAPATGRPRDVVERLVAVQSQDYAAAKWAVGMRLRGATDPQVERAFDAGSILRTHVLRPTWHFVSPRDLRWLLDLTGPRLRAGTAATWRRLGLGAALLPRACDAVGRVLEAGGYLTRDEVREALRAAGIAVEAGQPMTHLMAAAEFDGIACSGPRRGKRFTYALLDRRVPAATPRPREEALAEMGRRWLPTRAPATAHDLAWWAGLPVADARLALAAAGKGRRSTAEGRAPAAHFLPPFDEFVSSYKDLRDVADDRARSRFRATGNGLVGAVVVDGRVAGTWQRALGRDTVAIAARLLDRPSAATERALRAAARRYGEFLGLAPELTLR